MIARTEKVIEYTPQVYCTEDSHFFLSWIAEGTDGNLYVVPSEPGGWRHRMKYDGDKQLLIKVSEQKARAIMKFVGGDSGLSRAVGRDTLGTEDSTFTYVRTVEAQHAR